MNTISITDRFPVIDMSVMTFVFIPNELQVHHFKQEK